MYKNWPLIVAVVAGLLGTYFLYNYVRDKEKQAAQAQRAFEEQAQQLKQLKQELEQLKNRKTPSVETGVQKVPVIVAKRKIPAGTVIAPGMVEDKMIPFEAKLPSAAATMDAVLGKLVTVDLAPGEQLLLDRLISPELAKQNLIPPGTRLVTINVEQLGLFYFVRPGDKVDIAMLFTLPTSQVVSVGLFSDVEVKAVNGKVSFAPVGGGGQEVPIVKRGQMGAGPVGEVANPDKGTLTFALPPKEAAILYMASKLGKIEIFPRARFDSDKTKIPAITVDAVLQYAMPEIMEKAKAIAAKQEAQQAGQGTVMGVEVIKVRRGKRIEEKQITPGAGGANKGLIKKLRERIMERVGEGMDISDIKRIVREVLEEEAKTVPSQSWYKDEGLTSPEKYKPGGVIRKPESGGPEEYLNLKMENQLKKNLSGIETK